MSFQSTALNPSQGHRAKGLKKMGVSEDDVRKAEKLLSEIPPIPPAHDATKVEELMGYAECRIKREKAIKRMGTSEDEVELVASKNLGSLGTAARRRSFIVTAECPPITSSKHRRHTTHEIRKSARIFMKHQRKEHLLEGRTCDLIHGIKDQQDTSIRACKDAILMPIAVANELKFLRKQAQQHINEINSLRSRLGKIESRVGCPSNIVSDGSEEEQNSKVYFDNSNEVL